MLTIRLSRVGKKKQPTYRFVLSEKARDPWGHQLEILGHYNPRTNPATLVIKEDRLKYWISKGTQLSDTVNNLLIDKKLIEGDKRRIVKINKKKQQALVDEKAKQVEVAAKAVEKVRAADEATKEAEKVAAEQGAEESTEVPAEAPVETPAPEAQA